MVNAHIEEGTWTEGVRELSAVRRIFGLNRDDVTVEWSRMHNEKLCGLYYSQNMVWGNKSRSMGLAGHVARMGERIVVYRVLVGRREGKRPLGRSMGRWEDNIKTKFQEG